MAKIHFYGHFITELLENLSFVQCFPVFSGICHVVGIVGCKVVGAREIFFGTHVQVVVAGVVEYAVYAFG